MADIKKIVDQLSELKVIEAVKLAAMLEEKWGVSANTVSAAPGPTASTNAEVKEEKTSFDVILKSAGPQKIKVIKAVKEITGKGLKDAKSLVDALVSTPAVLKEGVDKKTADEIKEKLLAEKAEVEVK